MFAILTLYPQPTHLEYGKSLAQAQHHPSIHPPSSQHPKPHSLTSMLHNSPPQTSPHQIRNSSSIRQIKKIKNTRDERVASPPQLDPVFFFFGEYGVVLVFLPFAALLSQSIYFFWVEPCRFLFFFWAARLGCYSIINVSLLPLFPFSFFVRFGSVRCFASGAVPMALEKPVLTVLLRGVCT